MLRRSPLKPSQWLCIIGAAASLQATQVQADTYLRSYICHTNGPIRINGGEHFAQSRLEFWVYKNDQGLVYLRRGVGHILVGESLDTLLHEPYAYYGFYRFSHHLENPDYKPTTYFNHYQFRNFNAKYTNGADGGGMWGSFVIPKSLDKKTKAHYIFQAGSHIGGTIDYECE